MKKSLNENNISFKEKLIEFLNKKNLLEIKI